MGLVKKVVWLISSKDIEELNKDVGKPKRCIHTDNSESIDIFDRNYTYFDEHNRYISLGTFYHDLFLKASISKPLIENITSSEYQIDWATFNFNTVLDGLKKYNTQNELGSTTEIRNFSIFRLKDNRNVFYTRSYPVVLCNIISLYSPGFFIWTYWLASYIESVCRIMQIKPEEINDYTFKFLLHDKDIGLSENRGVHLLNSKIPNDIPFTKPNKVVRYTQFCKEIIKSDENVIHTYQHGPDKLFYKNIISKENFFKDDEDPDEKLSDALKSRI